MASKESAQTTTRAEVAKHNNSQSLWIIVHNKVYDVTKFMDSHPGGEEVLLEMAGKDATETFEEIGHSTDARSMIKEYHIGDIVQSEIDNTEYKTYYFPPNVQETSKSSSSFSFFSILAVILAVVVGYQYLYAS